MVSIFIVRLAHVVLVVETCLRYVNVVLALPCFFFFSPPKRYLGA